jgi:hypothetical protein
MRTGQLLTGSYMDYCMPRADDVPFYTMEHNTTVCPATPLASRAAARRGRLARRPLSSTPSPMPLARMTCKCLQRPSASGLRCRPRACPWPPNKGGAKMYPTTHHKPADVSRAAELVSGAEDGKLLAGGMTLLPTMKQHLAAPTDLVDLGGIAALKGITVSGDTLTIGAMTTHRTVRGVRRSAAFCPALATLAGGIGDPAVRARGTIGGSLANNDPAACYPAPCWRWGPRSTPTPARLRRRTTSRACSPPRWSRER